MLLAVLQRLKKAGNTVIFIEHNLDVIKTADWIIDLAQPTVFRHMSDLSKNGLIR